MIISCETCYGGCTALQKKWCLSHGFHHWFPKKQKSFCKRCDAYAYNPIDEKYHCYKGVGRCLRNPNYVG